MIATIGEMFESTSFPVIGATVLAFIVVVMLVLLIWSK